LWLISPYPWGIKFNGLLCVIELSNCLNDPDAALRGFENLSFSSKDKFNASKSFLLKNTSPLISIKSYLELINRCDT